MFQGVDLIDVNPENVSKYGFCFYSDPKNIKYQNKLEWFENAYKQGLKYKILYSVEEQSLIGMIEYIPGEYSWRAVDAKNFMVIHCLMVKKSHSKRGYGSYLINQCIEDAREGGMDGVIALTTKKSWCTNNSIYLKNGFEVADQTALSFQLMVKRLKTVPLPTFGNLEVKMTPYMSGVYMFYSKQCPFMSAGNSIARRKNLLKSNYDIDAHVIELKTCEDAQANPCVWGTYGIVANGKVVNYIPGGDKFFMNSLKKLKIIKDV